MTASSVCTRVLIAVPITLLMTQLTVGQKLDWQKTPRMTLERQFAGPLTDTLIQRLRDPIDGSICYVYLPISAAHTERTDNGYVQYGPNTIGTISCTAATLASNPTTSSIPGSHK